MRNTLYLIMDILLQPSSGSLFYYCVFPFRWIEACISETLPATTELEEGLMNGVILAKLGHFMAPEKVLLKKIYDIEEKRYQVCYRLIISLSR